MRRPSGSGVPTNALFAKGELHPWIEKRKVAVLAAVDGVSKAHLMSTDIETLTSDLVERHIVENITLDEDELGIDEPEDGTVQVNDFGRGPVSVRATRTRVFLRFSGDPALFQLRGSTILSLHPRATVRNGELVFEVTDRDLNGGKVKSYVHRQIGLIKDWLQGVTPMINDFNQRLPNLVRQRLEERRNKLIAATKAVAETGFKLRQRPGAVETYTPPSIRRKVAPVVAKTGNATKPEPALSTDVYEDILNVVSHAMTTAERSPSVFKSMGEEDIRQIVLLFLNAVFQGEAVAEAFNSSGKTDILIRHEDKNLFIAECKFWSGPKSLGDAIDQLLSYTTWRDTKTAIVLLSRKTKFSTVLAGVPDVLKKHPCFIRLESEDNQAARFRAVLSRPGDDERHVVATVLAFDVPG